MGLVLLIIPVLFLIGGLPGWGYHSYDYKPSGVVGIAVIVLIVLGVLLLADFNRAGWKENPMKSILLAAIKNFFESIQELSRKAHQVKDPRHQGLVVTDAEAEHQAYQEARREHSGG
jgi:hypothetical protein